MVAQKPLILILTFIFFIFIFSQSVLSLRDFDIWFHIKSGEIISQLGIIHYDVFSHSASGREWAPYEWLFQVFVYHFQNIFGFQAIKYLMAVVVTIHTGIIYLTLRKVFDLNRILSFSLSFIYLVSVYEFLTARPHLFAYTFLVFNLFLILLYFFKGKNLLFLTIPITLIWANLHGSIFLDVAFFAGYALISLVNFSLFKQQAWWSKFKTLGIYTLITTVLTILPPLGFLQYQLLWRFFQLREFISSYIDEWAPLSTNPYGFIDFTVTAILILLIFIITNFKQKTFLKNLWVIPLLPVIIWPYLAVRNIFLAYISLTLILGWNLARFQPFPYRPTIKYLLIGLLVVSIGFHSWLLKYKKDLKEAMRFYYPVNATQFIKNYNLQGNMFNEYGYGGYLLYHLYPDHKVFFDGRTDIYLCCEMPDTLELATKKFLSDEEYKKLLDKLWDKYNISYVLLRPEKHTILRKIMRILTDDPKWGLVFWDDHTQMFVREDGKNDQLLKNLEAFAATPYNKNPFREGAADQALKEYQRMNSITPSARSHNAIGFILLQQGQYDAAKAEFEQALKYDHTFESPYMNLAELAAKDGDLDTAIKLYQQARERAPDRGLIYIRLGQLFLEKTGDLDQAKKIWQQGLKETVDDEAKEKLKELLSRL